jgi:hypothetical protein
MDFSADTVTYRRPAEGSSTTLALAGNVTLQASSFTVRASRIDVDLDSRTAFASGGLEVDDGLSVLFGSTGTFDLQARTARLWKVRAGYSPWRIRAREAELFGDRSAQFLQARFTSCDEAPPDFFFRASTIRLMPGKALLAWNPVFYLHGVPLFYSPFLWKSLRKEHLLRTRVMPGYDRRNGAFLRTTTVFSIAPWMYGKLYIDGYSSQGIAAGAELQHRSGEDSRGALYGYHIRERGSGRDRWTFLADEYRTIASSYAFQARFQAQSDADFNNNYVRSNAFRVTPELINNAAFLRRTAFSTTRLSYARKDVNNPETGRFLRDVESMPRLDFQTSPMAPRGIPWLTTLSAFADNRFDRALGFLQRSAGASAETTRNIRLFPGAGLAPKLSAGETFESRRDELQVDGSTRTLRDVFVGRYQGGANLQVRTPIGYWDAGYQMRRRLKPDAFSDDTGAIDRGVEENGVTVQDTLLPRRGVVLRAGSGYDFRTFRDRALGFRDRVAPIFVDANWSSGLWQLSLRDDYKLSEGNRSFLAQLDFGDRTSNFAGFGVTETLDRPGHYFAACEGGWAPSSASWRVSGALRFDAYTLGGPRFESVQLFEKELSLTKDLHDFHARLNFRIRPGGVAEVSFRMELLGGLERARRIIRQGWESEWFPWRRAKAVEDD